MRLINSERSAAVSKGPAAADSNTNEMRHLLRLVVDDTAALRYL